MSKKKPKTGPESGTIKLNFEAEVPVEQRERFKMIMYACGLKSFGELMNHSFSILEWAVLETIKGQQVGSVSIEGDKINLLDAPSLRKASEMRDQILAGDGAFETLAEKDKEASTVKEESACGCGSCDTSCAKAVESQGET